MRARALVIGSEKKRVRRQKSSTTESKRRSTMSFCGGMSFPLGEYIERAGTYDVFSGSGKWGRANEVRAARGDYRLVPGRQEPARAALCAPVRLRKPSSKPFVQRARSSTLEKGLSFAACVALTARPA